MSSNVYFAMFDPSILDRLYIPLVLACFISFLLGAIIELFIDSKVLRWLLLIMVGLISCYMYSFAMFISGVVIAILFRIYTQKR